MAVEIGALRALLSLDSAAFERGARRAQASMSGLQRSLTRAAAGMKSAGKKMTAGVTLPLVAMAGAAVRSSLSTIDAQSKMAQSLSTSTRSMQVLARAADRAGLSTGELEQISRELTKRLSEAATGGGPAAKALDRLGLSAEGLAGLDLDQKIAQINTAILEQIPAAERAAVAAQVFGSRAGLVAGRLDPATIAAASAELEKFGVTVTEIEADRIEEANDAISALGLVVTGLGNQLAVALAPVLKSVAESFADWAAKFSALEPRTQRMVALVAAFAAAAGPLALGLGFVATGLVALASPIGLVVIGLAAVAGAAGYVAANWDQIKRDYPGTASALEKFGGAAKTMGEGMAETLQRQFAAAERAMRAGVDLYRAVIEGDLTAVMASLKSVIKAAVDGAIANLDLLTLGGASALIDAVTGMRDAVTQNLPMVGEALRGLGGKAKAAIAEIMPDFVLAGMDVAKGILTGLRERLAAVVAAVVDLGPKIIAAIGEMAAGVIQAAKDLGSDLVEGIKLGISEKVDSAASTIRDAFRYITGQAKEAVESKSPSRVFMRIGRDLMSGAEIGIGQGAPAAAAAAGQAGRLAAGAMDDAVAAAGTPQLQSHIASIGDALAGVVLEGRNLGASLAQVFQQIAKDLLSSGIQNALSGLFGGATKTGGGGVFGTLLGGIFGGFRADGGPVSAGTAYVVGERGPEMFVPSASGQIIPNGGGGGTSEVVVTLGAGLEAQILRQAAGQSVQIASSMAQEQSKALPGRMQSISSRGT